jgi:predicted nucleic acid-binding protein
VIVVDASVVATALVDDEADGAAVRDRLRGERLTAPEVVDLEVLSVIRRLFAAAVMTQARADQAVNDLSALPLERASHRPLLARCWQLRHNLSPYDAAYVALAEALGTTLVTGDVRLSQAPGATCPIEVIANVP